MIVRRPQRKSWMLTAPALAALLLFEIAPSPARAEVVCLRMSVSCVEAASDLDGVPRRSWAGLPCASNLLARLQYRLA